MGAKPVTRDAPWTEEVLEIARLNLDVYQRGLNQAWLNARNEFDLVKAGQVLVSRRDLRDYLIDGQHRVRLAERSGETHIIARVLHGLSRGDEAALFFSLGTESRGLRPQDKWRASLTAGQDGVAKHQHTVAIDALVESLGGVVNLVSHSNGSGINCPQTLWRIHASAGLLGLGSVLRLLSDAWPDEHLSGATTTTQMLTGSALFLATYTGQFRRDVLVRKLQATAAEMVLARGKGIAKTLHITEPAGVVQALGALYNERLPSSSRLQLSLTCDWREVKNWGRRLRADGAD